MLLGIYKCKDRPRRPHRVVWFSKKLSKVCKQSDCDDFDDYCDKVDDDGDEKEKFQSVMYRIVGDLRWVLVHYDDTRYTTVL